MRPSDRADTTPAVKSNIISTLAELRTAAATSAWPSRGLAVRAGILATNGAMSSSLVRIAEGRYLRAARLWLRIGYYLHDVDQLVAVLRLAAQCAALGGNDSFARNCVKRAAGAERQRHAGLPADDAAAC
jgi:hypothetical protein